MRRRRNRKAGHQKEKIMKKKVMIIGTFVAAGIFVLAGIGFYLNPGGVADMLDEAFRRNATSAAKTETGHQGHGGACPPLHPRRRRSRRAETQAAEPPTVEIPADKQPLIGMKTVAVAVRSAPPDDPDRRAGGIRRAAVPDGQRQVRRVDRTALCGLHRPTREKGGAPGRSLQPGTSGDAAGIPPAPQMEP